MEIYTKFLLFGSLFAGIASVVYISLSRRRQRRPNSPSEVHPTKLFVVTEHEEWQHAYTTLAADLLKTKVVGFDCEWVCQSVGGGKSQLQRPVSLLQLATESGVCVLVRLNFFLEQLPESLIALLEDRSILKVGVACLEDAKRLWSDRGIVCAGCVDLRHLALRTMRISSNDRLGLASLAKLVLGVDLNKSLSVRVSNWEDDVLTPDQLHYAACDALAAVRVFTSLVKLRGRSRTEADILRINSLCQGIIDVRFTTRRGSGGGDAPLTADFTGVAASKPTGGSGIHRAYVVRKKPLYHNCQLRGPDSQLLCTCDIKKATWYLDRGLAVKKSDEPLVVQLLFEPSGRPHDERNYYLHEKDNVCVVCGATESYIRKNIIPREYRKHFPAMLKEHKSHDVLLLCVQCHQRSNLHDNELKRRLVARCTPNAVHHANGRDKYINDPTLVGVKSAAKALLSRDSRQIPEPRLDELRMIVCNFFGVQQLDVALLQEAAAMDTRSKRDGFEDVGRLVVWHFIEHEKDDGGGCGSGGLVGFERLWRQHFVDTMKPRHLPAMWSIDHSHSELRSLEREVLYATGAEQQQNF